MVCTRPFVSHSVLKAFILVIFLVAGTSLALSQDVLTFHNNNARNGLDSAETILTLKNVNSATFGKLFTVTTDGLVDAQPLYLSAVTITGGTVHNLLIVATENDSVYAFDADSGTPIWHVSTIPAGETVSDDRGCNLVTPTIGITSTPVINRPTGTNGVIYLVAATKNASDTYIERLHALDATTGKELYAGPVEISAKYPGTGDNSSGGHVYFNSAQYVERAALLLLNNVVYLTWSSHCDVRPYTGWIMGYNATTLAQTSVLNVTPNGHDGAIWGAGAGPAADTLGNIFFLDANGTFDTTLTSAGFPTRGDYGNAFIRLTTTNGILAVADYFEMWNGEKESNGDIDLGSGGAILLPQVKDSSGKAWSLAVGAGKDYNLYVVNRSSMGKFSTANNNIYQELTAALPIGVRATPAYFDGKLYYGPTASPMLAFQLTNARFQTTPVAQTVNSFDYPGTTPSISSNGNINGIVWASSNTNPAVLYAYNVATLQELYNSSQAANNRDHFGRGNKFIVPVIANGKVYVGTATGVGVFGLLPTTDNNSDATK